MIAKEIQKPPYEDRAVAPKVFPMAISLRHTLAFDRAVFGNSTELATNLPHTSQQLDETTVTESESDDNVGRGDTASVHVDGAQNEGGEGESAQAERSRVGELAFLDGLVQTGLELTTEGTEASLTGIDVSQRPITEASSGASNFVLLSRHLRLNGAIVGSRRRSVAEVLLQSSVVGDFGRHDDCEILRSATTTIGN